MNKKIIKTVACAIFINLATMSSFSQSQKSSQSHQSLVSNLVEIPDSNKTSSQRRNASGFNFFSAGADGFLINWSEDGIGEHYQVSDIEIRLVAISPDGNEVAVYETDGARENRVSVWDWKKLNKKFTKHFSDSITSLAYSAKGKYLLAGTATVDGVVAMNPSNGNIADLIHDSTGIVSYISTSDTEKTAITYSPAGNISYYSLGDGHMTKRFTAEQGLTQPILFNNGLYLAGVRSGTIYICYALTGQTLASYKCSNPVLLSSADDPDLFFMDSSGRGNYTIFVMRNRNNKGLNQTENIATISTSRSNQSISTGIKSGDIIVFGTQSGEIYKVDVSASTSSMQKITENTYDKVLDVSPIENDFYFLTRNNIYRSGYSSKQIQPVASNNRHNRIISMDRDIILWTEDSRSPVELVEVSTGTKRTLFTPKAALQTVKLFGRKIVSIENYSNVYVYDFNTEENSLIYTGTALQDAVIMNDENVYVAKSSATLPNTPLVAVNIQTGETVPIQLNANVAFSLSANDQTLYGIAYKSGGSSRSTFVFSYDIRNKKNSSIINIDEEDLKAFTYLGAENIYTNMGSDKPYCYNLKSKNRSQLERSSSISQRISENGEQVVILNYDGSVSWHKNTSSKIMSNWYLTKDGSWYEF